MSLVPGGSLKRFSRIIFSPMICWGIGPLSIRRVNGIRYGDYWGPRLHSR